MDPIYSQPRAGHKGVRKTEFCVPCMIFGLLLLPVDLFWHERSAQTAVYFILVDIGVVVFVCSSSILSQALLAHQLDEFAEVRTLANAASRFLPNVLGLAPTHLHTAVA
ncbi:hypothetical protein F4859DRAFT_509714 [Xylaria cf. heliscus]|nr:hypothetical protein F4859DRAFT_509714 [Xylaria cf. heliscus]